MMLSIHGASRAVGASGRDKAKDFPNTRTYLARVPDAPTFAFVETDGQAVLTSVINSSEG
jgi:hypothetical protein